MSIVNTLALESNRQIKINFDGGDLSSDAGLLLIKEFISKLGIDTLLEKAFKTNDPALFRYHSDPKNLLQMIYMIIAGYFEDDASDELTNLIKFYCKRGLMENFIKESKSGFDFASVSSHTRIVNANRLQVHALAYNIFNWFRRLALSANMRKQRIDTVRLKLLKIAAKVVHSARYITFKLCSSCPYKNEFYETLSNIGKLNIQLE